MRRYTVSVWTGPTEVKQRAAYAADDVLEVREGTEHVYVVLNAEDSSHAWELACDALGYVVTPRRSYKGESVTEVIA